MYLRHVITLLLHYHRNSHKTRSYLHIKQSDVIFIEGWDTLTFSFKDSCSCVSLLALARRSTRQNSHSRLLYLTPENCTTTAPLPDIFKNLKTKLYPTKLAKKKNTRLLLSRSSTPQPIHHKMVLITARAGKMERCLLRQISRDFIMKGCVPNSVLLY